ncbi:MAG TPA: glycosyltransferase family 4 protein [Gemmataceae bacterium]|nr:glycosyltransferase family 4 protein [Gemmataceae bacterium]
MRILFISERYPPHITGGYETACEAVAEGLSRRGHDVAVLTSDFGLPGGGQQQGNVFRLLHYCLGGPSLVRLARQEIADCRTARRVLASWKPDVVYAWCMLHLFPSLHHVLRRAGVPVAFNVQDVWLPRHLDEAERLRSVWLRPGAGLCRRAGKALVRGALRRLHPAWLRPLGAGDLPLDNVVFCSRFRLAEHERLGLPAGRSRVIYNGIDTTVFTGVPARDVDGPLEILFAGRIVPEKGAHTAVEAVGNLHRRGVRRFSLSIAGMPGHPLDYASGLRQAVEAQGLGDCVRFLGMVPHEALPEVFRRHHVLVFPSTVNEGLPMTLIEGMACGVAVVGTTTGGSAEVLRDGVNALTFPPGDAEALADCLLRLRQDAALRRSLAAAGQETARTTFDVGSAVAQTEAFLEEARANPVRRGGPRRQAAAAGAR